jgi:hypothetical protein
MTDEQAEAVAESMIQEIDQSSAAGSDVPRSASIAYYERIADHCRVCVRAIRDDEEREADGA